MQVGARAQASVGTKYGEFTLAGMTEKVKVHSNCQHFKLPLTGPSIKSLNAFAPSNHSTLFLSQGPVPVRPNAATAPKACISRPGSELDACHKPV